MSHPKSRSVLSHSLVYGIGNLLTQAANFFLLPIYLKYLAPADYGALEVLNRAGEVLVIVLLGRGLRQATLAFFRNAEGPEQRRIVATTTILTFGIVGLCGAVAALPLAGPLSRLLRVGDRELIGLAIVAIYFESMTAIPLALIQARMESLLFVLATMGQFLVRVVLCIAMVVGLGWGVFGVLLASALTFSASALLLCGRELRHGARLDRSLQREIIRFTLPFLPGGLCMFLMDFGDRFFLLEYGGAAAVGIYSFGYKLASMTSMFSLTPLYMVWGVLMYDAAKTNDGPRAFGRAFTWIIGSYVALGLAIAMLEDEIVLLLGGARYGGSSQVVAPVVLAYGFLAASCLMDSSFYVMRRTGRKVWIAAASAATMLILYALLIRPFGAMGAAFATLIGFAAGTALTYRASQSVYRVQYEWGRVLAMLLLAAALWSVSRALPVGGVSVIGKAALWCLWMPILWFGGAIAPDEKRWALQKVGIASDTLKMFLAWRPRVGAPRIPHES